MRFHIPNLPHTMPTRDFDWCAYTAKVRKFADMLTTLGHDPIVYASSDEQRARWFPGETWDNTFTDWDVGSPVWQEWNASVITTMRELVRDHTDIVALIGGWCQHPIADAFPNNMTVEWGIGYKGVLEKSHKVYESWAHLHYMHGQRWRDDGVFFDTVIPNSFNPDELTFSDEQGEYLLYLGRITQRKGIQIVADVARATGLPLRMAGQLDGRLDQWDWSGIDMQHLGVVLGDDKAKLLAGARCLLAPTLYLEPFGGVAVEAMMSGTPAITTDFGAFTETVTPATGFRCSTLADFVRAVDEVDYISRHRCMRLTRERYSTSVVAKQYDAYFARLATLWGDGWYQMEGS